jgi:uncharacterized protein YndB with AHSA1/START domain
MISKHRVTREAFLPAPRPEVWAALTEADRLADWLGGDVQIDPQPRGKVVVRGKGGVERRGRVIAVNRPYRLVLEWWEGRGDEPRDAPVTRVEFLLQEEDDGTRLTVSEWPAVHAAGFTEAAR